MRQVLFRIPLDGPWSLGPLGEWPGFGFGVVLLVWVLFGAFWLFRNRTRLGLSSDVLIPVALWLVAAWAIVMTPRWAQRGFDRTIAEESQAIERTASPSAQARHYHLRGLAWREKREYEKAAADFQTAIESNPGYKPAYHSLAWLKATAPRADVRDGETAVRLATQAASLTVARDVTDLDVLAAAYAETGRFEEAVNAAGHAAQLARSASGGPARGELPEIRQRLALYEGETPYREAPAGKSVPVYGYGFMLFLGFVAAGWDATRRARRIGLVTDDPGRTNLIWDIGVGGVISGIIGARLFYLIQYHERVFAGADTLGDVLMAAVNLPDGGLVLYGGLLVGSAAFLVLCRMRKVAPLLLSDVAIPAVFLALAFGRLGCLMNGCCYGDRCELPWAIEFPIGSVPDMSLVNRGFVAADDVGSAVSAPVMRLHPSQLYSSLNGLILWFVTATYFRYRNRDGAVLGLALLSYPVTRFLIEYVRGDEMGQFDTSLTISQLVSLGIFATGLLYLAWLSTRPRVLTLDARDPQTHVAATPKPHSQRRAAASR